ncbi:hypothetical protein G6514_002068 [Epicoccum nigrum]|nr:hypothetical protein G6514_002068 [Epicoccum nigrum]
MPTEVRQAWLSTNPHFNEDHLICGFCGLDLSTWEERRDHVARHIKEGATRDMWMPNREAMCREHYEHVSANQSPPDLEIDASLEYTDLAQRYVSEQDSETKKWTRRYHSSIACLLRHEREAHGMHGHGARPHLCHFQDCERAVPGYGFPRRYLFDHMKRVHQFKGPTTEASPIMHGQAQRKPVSRKSKASAEDISEKHLKVVQLTVQQLLQQRGLLQHGL